MIKKCLLIAHLTLLSLSFSIYDSAEAQSADQEVFLQFRHQGVVNTYVSAIYDQDKFYLSVSDLFESLRIDFSIDQGSLTVSGNYLGKGRYVINLDSRQARFLDQEILLTADDYIITDFGYYLVPDIYYELFDMEFIVDFSNLAISLESPDTMPIVAQQEREQRRERLLRTQRELRRDFYPLRFDRNKSVVNGGFVDYNLTANINQTTNSYLYSTNIGAEIIGGDLQGTIFGSYSQNASSLRSSGLRWRYGVRNNDWVSSVIAGQTTAEGLAPVAYTGIRLTNEPIEPRYLYDETVFTGNVDPDSEVELYRNNTLIDFTQADGSGSYRFTIPLTYGTSNYTIRAYSPTGQLTVRDARLQIPFNFLPPGEVNYTINAGRIDNPIAGSTERGLVSKANVSAGLTDRFTATGGVEYFEDFHDDLPTFTGRISSRVSDSYLLSFEAANNAFYRASGSVIYPNNTSLNLDYTYYNTQGGIYNSSRNQSSIRANLFTPFSIGDWPLFLRWSVTNEQRETGAVTRYRVDFNTRIGRANLRFGYRDTQLGRLSFDTTPVARLNSSVTYNFSRSRDIPSPLRSLFIRAQTNFIPSISRFEDAEIQFSRNITRRGRLQFSAGRNFIGDFNLFRFSLTFDFNSIRSNTTVRSTRNSTTLTQSLRGSVGYDSNHNNFHFTNRQQVGRSGVAVRMYVDSNNSGRYDEGDELIPDNAIRIDRAGGNSFSKENVHYISQLQPYRQYNMTVNKGSISNPLLVPELEQFSIVTDPNQYKLIEIPLYMSGIVEGKIERQMPNGEMSGLGGLRLYLRQINVPEGAEPHTEEIRTFSDGSFYTYEVPPGDYVIEPDPTQLNFLDVTPDVATLEFEVRPLAEGDFVEGLAMTLLPSDDPVRKESVPDTPVIALTILGLNGSDISVPQNENCSYSIHLSSFKSFSEAIDFASHSEQFTNLELDIKFNSNTGLYSVQTPDLSDNDSLNRTIADFRAGGLTQVAILHNCEYDEDEAEFNINLASFDNRSRAISFRDQLQSELGFQNLYIYPDRNTDRFKVLVGPFPTQNELIRFAHNTFFDERYNDLLASIQAETTAPVSTDLTYLIRIQSFDDEESAQSFVDQNRDRLDQELQVIEGNDGQFEVVTQQRAQTLDEIRDINESITAATGIRPRGIMMYELHEQDPDTSKAAAQPEVIEILEEEEFVTEADTAETDQLPVEISIPTIEESISCFYPIQVGSFGNMYEAQKNADNIGERIDEEVKLIYNADTDLFALRTDPIETVENALLQLLFFRDRDSYNQYAIVGQCDIDIESIENQYARFVIPIDTTAEQNQSVQIREELNLKSGVEFFAKSDTSQEIFTIYAGPFNHLDRADEVRNILLDMKIISEDVPVMLDPEKENSLDLTFKIYLGNADNLSEYQNTASKYSQDTDRRLTLEILDDQIQLYDQEFFRSWLEFLQKFEEIKNRTDLRPLEIFILE
ncbi:SPOR domain-containing protein [Rhodohalobacter halophilus]|uniref:SPOR domain-containing protein n=1 Tax=Rhodohalobacter halophilus TaxID=1812810 RepID=UPI00083FAC43|nr:SPOR domain-containing protein [Rhodohalobacter halophilus]